ncbi:BTB/POZ and MATH domain-containing protein 1-like [Miscanthus floridulus]|uniref:BTB/POZ and MATH domain-containing protein 1-like n=1 Tax=Miscanthus floridulus TaxID=154761 RepID=UPI00345973AF
MSSVPPLLSAPGAGKPSRSASAVVAKATRGFQVFRIDGYSWTKALPGGERITSEQFNVGGRFWHIDYYPNGTDGSNDSAGSIALYLRLQNTYKKERVRAQYKFSLLDLAGNEAYELPAETGIFRSTGRNPHNPGEESPEDPGCGYAGFITKEDLEKRRNSLLKEDCLAIRCDVGVTEVTTMAVGPKNGRPATMRNYPGGYGYGYAGGAESPDEDLEDDGGSHKGRRSEPDDKEYIRRCLSAQRHC